MKIQFLLLLLIAISACKQVAKEDMARQTKADTLFPPRLEANCSGRTDGYRKLLGVYISNFYIEDGKIQAIGKDSMIILKPYYLSNGFNNCIPEKIDKNILLASIAGSKAKFYDCTLFSDDRNVYQEIQKKTIALSFIQNKVILQSFLQKFLCQKKM